jgi:hypothetical protein
MKIGGGKMRNWNAQVAHFRNSGGAMKDKKNGRGGSRNEHRDLLEEGYEMKQYKQYTAQELANLEGDALVMAVGSHRIPENKDSVLDNDVEYQIWMDNKEKEIHNSTMQFYSVWETE